MALLPDTMATPEMVTSQGQAMTQQCGTVTSRDHVVTSQGQAMTPQCSAVMSQTQAVTSQDEALTERGLKPVVGPPESITVWTNASPLSPAALPNVNPASDSVVGGERPKSLISPLAPQATRRDGCPQIPHPFLSEIPQRARTSKPLPSWFAAVGPASHGEGRGAVASRS
ncbi:unnamed protein product [Caretta caretta]